MEFDKYLKQFNKVFHTNLDNSKTQDKIQLLEVIFKALENELYSTTTDYQLLTKKYVDKVDKLMETLDKEQEELFEVCNELFAKMNEQMEQQMFIYGYLLAKIAD